MILCDELREKFKNVLMKEGIEFGKKGRPRPGKKQLMQLLLGTRLQGANKETASQAAPRNSELLPRRYALGEKEFENRLWLLFFVR